MPADPAVEFQDRAGNGSTVTPRIEARDVTFGYRAGVPVLDRWSATFLPRTMTAITGPSGRGKSTLLYLLGLMLKPSAGDVLIDGKPGSAAGDSHRAALRANRFGFVFQDAALDQTRSVLDNIVETSLYRGQRRSEASTRALELLDRFGVNVPAHRKPGQVSGGQAQRIALCRALLNDPAILLADEPTGNLDPGTAALVVTSMRSQAESGASVIVVTHSPDVAAACDKEIRL